MNPQNTVFNAKRLIGRRFDDAGVQSDMTHWPFTVKNDNGKPRIQVEYKGETKTFFPEEVSSMVLNKMKETAEAYLGMVRETKAPFLNKYFLVLYIRGKELVLSASFRPLGGGCCQNIQLSLLSLLSSLFHFFTVTGS